MRLVEGILEGTGKRVYFNQDFVEVVGVSRFSEQATFVQCAGQEWGLLNQIDTIIQQIREE